LISFVSPAPAGQPGIWYLVVAAAHLRSLYGRQHRLLSVQLAQRSLEPLGRCVSLIINLTQTMTTAQVLFEQYKVLPPRIQHELKQLIQEEMIEEPVPLREQIRKGVSEIKLIKYTVIEVLWCFSFCHSEVRGILNAPVCKR
jgi:hypothetical protein